MRGQAGGDDASTRRGDPFGSFAFQFIGAVRSGTSRYGYCVACHEGSRSTDEDFSCRWTRRHRQGTTVSVSGRTVSVTARINNRLQQNSRHILAAEFDISVGGIQIPTLLAGAIGVADTPDHARDTAAAEWAAQYGAPIGLALASRFGASALPSYAKLEVDGQVLFHGPPGLRGEAKVTAAVSSDEFLRRVATLVVASLRRKPPVSEYRSALVQIVVTGTAVTGGECRVDGLISTELLETLSKLAWPKHHRSTCLSCSLSVKPCGANGGPASERAGRQE